MASSASSEIPNNWRLFVEKILSVWSGYQLAVDFNSAGTEILERHKWFTDVLAEHVYTTRGLKADDLEEWITSLLFNDFDLILDDDSVYPTSHLLLEGFSYMKNDNLEKLNQLIASLPTPDAVQQAKQASRRGEEQEDVDMDDVDEDMEDEDSDEGESTKNGLAGSSQRERQPRTVTDDDGWTTVLRR